MKTRRQLALAGGAGLVIGWVVGHRPAHAQASPVRRRVGLLAISGAAAVTHIYAAFRDGMHDLGWREGQTVEYRYAFADGDVDRLDALVKDLMAQQIDVIVIGNPHGIRAAQRATTSLPIVMAYGANAVGLGFVKSLAQPGGNITGITSQLEEVLGKLIGLLHEAAPAAQRLAVLLSEKSPSHELFWAVAQRACHALQLSAIRVIASAPAQLGAAIEQIARQRAQAVVVTADAMYLAERDRLQALIQPLGLPVAYGLREHVVGGGLLSYAADLSASFRHAARYVDKILKGARPADLPVEQPTRFELVLNLKTARALGLAIPPSQLLRADEVIP